MLELGAREGLWLEQRHHEAFLQGHANCPRCEIETKKHRFHCCEGNSTEIPTMLTVSPRLTLTKPERGLTPGSWLVEEPYDGPEVFPVAGASHVGFSHRPWHILLLMVPNCILIRAVVRLVGVSVLSHQIFNCAQKHMDQSRLRRLLYQWLNSWKKQAGTAHETRCARHSGPDCSKPCRNTRERSRSLGARPTSPLTTSTNSR